MKQNNFNIQNSIRKLLLVVGFIAFLVLIFTVSWKYFEKQKEEDISNTKPEYFPVVVVTPKKSELVFVTELEEYKKNNQNYTFLISDEKLVNQQLEIAQNDRRGKRTPQISVKPINKDKQLIEVRIGGDGLFNAKYEATDKEFNPLTLTVSGPLFGLIPCGTTIFIGFASFIILKLILRGLRKKQNKALI